MNEESYEKQLSDQAQELANQLHIGYGHAMMLMSAMHWRYRIDMNNRDLILCALHDMASDTLGKMVKDVTKTP